MAAGYGKTEIVDGTQCLIPYGEDSCLATDKEAFSNVGAAVAAGLTAGVVGTVISLAIVLPLSPILARFGDCVGV